MPILDGVDIVNALRCTGPTSPLCCSRRSPTSSWSASGLQAGAAAYIDKTEDRDAICLQLATIACSHRMLAPGS